MKNVSYENIDLVLPYQHKFNFKHVNCDNAEISRLRVKYMY